VLSYVIRGIKAKTIAVIVTVSPGSSIVQYLYAPKIHHDLGGEPKLIVGNPSNKLGEFSCIYIPYASLKLFACVAEKEKFDTLLKYLLDLENKALANTDWFNTIKQYVCALMSNFFILYFGRKPPTGDIMPDNVKMAFSTLRKGYKAWCTSAEEAITYSCKIATVLSNAANALNYNQGAFAQK
jgi:hypothetical protein